MKTRQEMVQDRETFLDRARGVMSGLAIGDSFGDASRKPDNQLAYGITTDFGEGASWSTDDTEFGLLTAQTLIEANGRLTPEIVAEAWKKHVVTQGEELNRGGNSEMEAAANLRRGLMPPYTGLYNAYAFSDGAAMRAAPIGIVFAGDLPGAAQARGDRRLHQPLQGRRLGRQSVACAVAAAVARRPASRRFSTRRSTPCPRPAGTTTPSSWPWTSSARPTGRLLDAWMPLHDRLATRYKASVPEAVSQAFGVLALSHEDFRTGVITAGNFGRDADTIAAICGAVLGGMYGYKAIPARWAEKTRYPSGTCLPMARGIDLLEIAGKLCALAQ